MEAGTPPGDPLHLVRFRWEGFTPRLSFARPDGGELWEYVPEPGSPLGLEFAGGHRCAGVVRDDGTHIPCPGARAPMERFIWCYECSKEVIPDPSCIFEPRCDGVECPEAFCSRPHAVYLALFGPKAKVGMTSMERLRERLTEQGADGYVLLRETANRQEAREQERMLAKKLRLPQAVRSATKLKLMASRPDLRAMKEKARVARLAVANLTGDRPPELEVLDGYPMPQPLKGRLKKVAEDGAHKGMVVGVKGTLLIYRQEGTNQLLVWKPGDSVGLEARFL